MADMVPISCGGNRTSTVREELRVLEGVAPGISTVDFIQLNFRGLSR